MAVLHEGAVRVLDLLGRRAGALGWGGVGGCAVSSRARWEKRWRRRQQRGAKDPSTRGAMRPRASTALLRPPKTCTHYSEDVVKVVRCLRAVVKLRRCGRGGADAPRAPGSGRARGSRPARNAACMVGGVGGSHAVSYAPVSGMPGTLRDTLRQPVSPHLFSGPARAHRAGGSCTPASRLAKRPVKPPLARAVNTERRSGRFQGSCGSKTVT